MNICLCCEASHAFGMGHLYRMLAFGEEFQRRGVEVLFVVNADKVATDVLSARRVRFLVQDLAAPIGWAEKVIKAHGIGIWVDDRLQTDARHTRAVHEAGARLVTFDNPGSGAAEADLHIAALPSFYEQHQVLGRRVLKGVEWLLLNPKVISLRRQRTRAEKLAVCLGGSDTYGVTVRVAEILMGRGRDVAYFVGPAFCHHAALAAVVNEACIRRGGASLLDELAGFDYAITGGGITAFEAAAMGLPTITIANERHEIFNAQLLARMGCSRFAGYHSEMREEDVTADLCVESMSKACLEGAGGDALSRLVNEVQRA